MESNNNAKLREAVASLIRAVNNYVVQVDFCGINPHARLRYDQNKAILLQELRKADAALAEPPRQCDIGTAAEQHERFVNFCSSHKYAKPVDKRRQ